MWEYHCVSYLSDAEGLYHLGSTQVEEGKHKSGMNEIKREGVKLT